MKKAFGMINKIFEVLSAISLAFMMVLITLQVIFRYVLSSPLAWTEEPARYTFIWVTFLASYVAAVKGEHVAINMLQERCKGFIRTGLVFISDMLTAAFFGIVGYYSVSQWSKLGLQTSAALKIPMNYVYLGIILGSFCMFGWYLYCALAEAAAAVKQKSI